MKPWMAVVSFLLLTSALSPAQTSLSKNNASEQQTPTSGVLPVRLSKNLDSTKAKAGDAFAGRTVTFARLSDGTGIPSHTSLVGHLAEATTKSTGDTDSTLGVVFDSILLSKGKELKIKGTLRAIGPAIEVSTGAATPGTIPNYSRGSPRTVAPPSTWTQDLNANSKNAIPTLNDKSEGVLGFSDLEMNDVLTF